MAGAPLVAFDGCLYRDFVVVLELELRRLRAGDGVVGEACGRAVKVDVVGGLGRGRRLGTGHARRGLRGLHGGGVCVVASSEQEEEDEDVLIVDLQPDTI